MGLPLLCILTPPQSALWFVSSHPNGCVVFISISLMLITVNTFSRACLPSFGKSYVVCFLISEFENLKKKLLWT